MVVFLGLGDEHDAAAHVELGRADCNRALGWLTSSHILSIYLLIAL